jgi:hypothetical protein
MIRAKILSNLRPFKSPHIATKCNRIKVSCRVMAYYFEFFSTLRIPLGNVLRLPLGIKIYNIMRKFAKKERKENFFSKIYIFELCFRFEFAVYFKRSNNFYVCFIWLCTHSIPCNIENRGNHYRVCDGIRLAKPDDYFEVKLLNWASFLRQLGQ